MELNQAQANCLAHINATRKRRDYPCSFVDIIDIAWDALDIDPGWRVWYDILPEHSDEPVLVGRFGPDDIEKIGADFPGNHGKRIACYMRREGIEAIETSGVVINFLLDT